MDSSAIPAQPSIGLLHVVVEVPAGGRNKYEYLPAPGLMGLDRVLHPSVQYPFDYGFVPNTLADDGSPPDAMVVMEEPTFPVFEHIKRCITAASEPPLPPPEAPDKSAEDH